MFIQTFEGMTINLAHVVAIKLLPAIASGYGSSACRVEFTMPSGHKIYGHVAAREADAGYLNGMISAVIPATPGHFVLEYEVLPDVGEYITQEPIIAWRVTSDDATDRTRSPTPITTFGICHGRTYVLHPDGTVVETDVGSHESHLIWGNYQKWLVEMRNEHSTARPWQEVYPSEADI